MAEAGVSTLGCLLGYAFAASDESTALPTTLTQLSRINAIGGISIDVETIDASALEDTVERAIAGRGSTGGTFSVTINVTDDTLDEWTTLITTYKANQSETDKYLWFGIYTPKLAKRCFIVVEPPTMIPMPAFDQNGLLTVELTVTINNYIGWQTSSATPAAKSSS